MAELGDTAQLLQQFIDQPRLETAQERFDATYITATEVMERVGVSRPAVVKKMSNRFPTIKIGNTFLWERSFELNRFVDSWATLRG